jgi:hypothetical protein
MLALVAVLLAAAGQVQVARASGPAVVTAFTAGGGGGSNLVPAGGTAVLATGGAPEIVISYAPSDTSAPTTTITLDPRLPDGSTVGLALTVQTRAGGANDQQDRRKPGISPSGPLTAAPRRDRRGARRD